MPVMPPKRIQIIIVGKRRTTSLQRLGLKYNPGGTDRGAASGRVHRLVEEPPQGGLRGSPRGGGACGAVPMRALEPLGKSRGSCGSQTSRKPWNPALTVLDRPCPLSQHPALSE